MFQWARRMFLGDPLAAERAELIKARTALVNAAALAIRARYDSAQTTDENRRLWGMSDGLSAKAANSLGVRKTLRERSRQEIANNAYAYGIVNTTADDLIGTGPTLQVRTQDDAANRQVEAAWASWCRAVGLVSKLRTLKLAKTGDGEGFWVLKTNEALDHAVKLYPLDIEADQVTTPDPKFTRDYWVDGMVLDPLGQPREYHVLRYHPGDLFLGNLSPLDYDRVPARHVIHWFKKTRPGQVRGIPELTPALDLFAEMRSYRKTVLAAARIAAAFSAVLESEFPAGQDDDEAGVDPFKSVPIDNGMMTALPAGMKLNQLEPKQPIANYDAYHEKLVGEACRTLNVPLNVALGTSQKFNFASARLDHVNYRAGLVVERADCDAVALEPLFAAWFDEAVMIPGLLPKGMVLETCPHEWHWPGFEPLDPVKDATADAQRLASGLDTYPDYWARRGYDWRDKFEQMAEAEKAAEKLGLSFGAPAETATVDEPDSDSGEERDEPADKSKPAPSKDAVKKVAKKAAGADVQATALNGAQVLAMVGVCDKLVLKQYTGEATKAILQGAFPGMDTSLIDTIVSELEDHEPPAPAPETEAASVA